MNHATTITIGLRRGLFAALAVATATVLALGAAANADAKNLGSTTLKPDKATFEALSDLGVAVTPIKPAKAGGKGIAFPITGAKLDKNLTGKIEHKGGLKFSGGGEKLAVKNFVVKIGDKSKLIAYAGKQKVKLLDLNLKQAKVKNGGKTVSNVKASLAKPGAEALSATFGADIKKGTPIGKVTVAFK